MNSVSHSVVFAPLDRTAQARVDETVLDAARRAGVPLANSCGGVGICARCRIEVLRGETNLSAPTTTELCTAAAKRFNPGERLACTAVVLGDCTVTTTYW